MKIEMAKEKFEKLLKLIYLGGWMINSFRIGVDNLRIVPSQAKKGKRK